MTYYINIRTFYPAAEQSIDLPVNGTEAAWAAYRLANSLADLSGAEVALVDGNTGEVIADNFSYDEEVEEDDPSLWDEAEEGFAADLDMGFDPYAGCYTFDC